MQVMKVKWWAVGAVSAALLSWPMLTFAHGVGGVHSAHAKTAMHNGPDNNAPLTSLVGKLATGGQTGVQLTVGSATYTLRFGPPWFTPKSSLGSMVGQTATVAGRVHGHSMHAVSVNGRALRGHGKPPWAAGAGAHHGKPSGAGQHGG